jgi:hypothetical protein
MRHLADPQQGPPAGFHRGGIWLPAPRTWLAAAAVVGGIAVAGELAAQRPATSGPAGQAGGPLWISDSAVDDARRMLVIVDSATRHAAVYHVDTATGSLTLKSTRNLSWDLLMADFNAQEPKPAALKRMLETGDGRPLIPAPREP